MILAGITINPYPLLVMTILLSLYRAKRVNRYLPKNPYVYKLGFPFFTALILLFMHYVVLPIPFPIMWYVSIVMALISAMLLIKSKE